MKKQKANFIAWGTVLVVLIGVAVLFQRTLWSAAPAGPADAEGSGETTYIAKGDTIEVSDDALAPADIQTAAVSSSEIPQTLTLTAKSGLNMDTVTHVSALFGGKVTDVSVGLGQAVQGPDEKGGPTKLCVIESNDLAQDKANWLQSLIQVKIDEQELARAKELFVANVLAEKFLIDAESQLMKDQSAQEASRQQLLIFGLKDSEIDGIRKEAALEVSTAKNSSDAAAGAKAAMKPEKTTEQIRRERMGYVLTAPRSGVIAEKFVAGGEAAVPQTDLFTIADTKTLWVWGDVYERDLDQVKVGQHMKVYFTSEPGRARDCTVDLISPVLDPNTHSVKIRGIIDNSDGRLLSDMYGTMIITVGDGKGSLIIPADAVVREEERAYVFVETAHNGGKTSFRKTSVELEPVDTGFGADMASAAAGSASRNTGSDKSSGQMRVAAGLKPGETIVISGGVGLYNEMKQQNFNQVAADSKAPDTKAPDNTGK